MAPFILECAVRKRLEKRMEVILSGVPTSSSGLHRSAIKLRSASTRNASQSPLSDSIIVGDANCLASEFVYSTEFNGHMDQIDLARNSIALKLIRSQKDKVTGLVTLIFDFVFCPAKSFM